MAHLKFWNQHYSFHWWNLHLSRMLGNIFAFLTLFSIGKILLFAAICWKSLLCLSPSLHNQISSLKFPASSPRREGEAAWTQTYGFLQVFFSASMQGRQFWIHPYYTLKQHTWGQSINFVQFLRELANTNLEKCCSIPKSLTVSSLMCYVSQARALTTSQSSSSQIPLTILTPNLSPLYTFSAVPLTTHTHNPHDTDNKNSPHKNREIKLNAELLTFAIHYCICTHCLFLLLITICLHIGPRGFLIQFSQYLILYIITYFEKLDNLSF